MFAVGRTSGSAIAIVDGGGQTVLEATKAHASVGERSVEPRHRTLGQPRSARPRLCLLAPARHQSGGGQGGGACREAVDQGFRRLLSTFVYSRTHQHSQDTTSLYEEGLLDELVANISTLASVYHKPPESFVSKMKGIFFFVFFFVFFDIFFSVPK